MGGMVTYRKVKTKREQASNELHPSVVGSKSCEKAEEQPEVDLGEQRTPPAVRRR